jgi:hypothetical protein
MQNTANQRRFFVHDVAVQKFTLTSSLAVWLTPKQYYCEDCHYVGIVVMELEKEENDVK